MNPVRLTDADFPGVDFQEIRRAAKKICNDWRSYWEWIGSTAGEIMVGELHGYPIREAIKLEREKRPWYPDMQHFLSIIRWEHTDKPYWRMIWDLCRKTGFVCWQDVSLTMGMRTVYGKLTGQQLITLVKRMRYEKRNWQPRYWQDVVDKYYPKHAGWLEKRVAKMLDSIKDSCIDNIRVCDPRKSSHRRRYLRQKKNGCCGFHDEVVTHWTGVKYWIGCNYGH